MVYCALKFCITEGGCSLESLSSKGTHTLNTSSSHLHLQCLVTPNTMIIIYFNKFVLLKAESFLKKILLFILSRFYTYYGTFHTSITYVYTANYRSQMRYRVTFTKFFYLLYLCCINHTNFSSEKRFFLRESLFWTLSIVPISLVLNVSKTRLPPPLSKRSTLGSNNRASPNFQTPK
jgi:hypothetical protein